MYDSDCKLLLAAADVTASLTDAEGVDFRGPDKEARTYMLNAPAVTGTNPTLDAKIQESDDNSTWRDFLAFPQITAAGQIFVSGKSNARYRRIYLTLGGTNPNFGKVLVAPVPGGRYNNW
jgi:hypothetical protein